MNFTIDFSCGETVRIDLIVPNNPSVVTAGKIGSVNLDADDDSDFLPRNHYDNIAIAHYLESERRIRPGCQPRMPRSITGLFQDLSGKHLALSDEDGELLAVYHIHRDGSMDRSESIPPCILEAYS